ncbi:small ribosomal subunit protein uS5m-like isoform X2 [Ictidomys tridecemlineatus]
MRNGAVQTIAQRSKEEQEQVAADMLQQREEWDWKRRMKVKRERGWSGNTWGGLSVGPPDPGPSGETYEDFDTRILEVRNVFNMTAKEGRKRSVHVLVAVGNGQGAAGNPPTAGLQEGSPCGGISGGMWPPAHPGRLPPGGLEEGS